MTRRMPTMDWTQRLPDTASGPKNTAPNGRFVRVRLVVSWGQLVQVDRRKPTLKAGPVYFVADSVRSTRYEERQS